MIYRLCCVFETRLDIVVNLSLGKHTLAVQKSRVAPMKSMHVLVYFFLMEAEA